MDVKKEKYIQMIKLLSNRILVKPQDKKIKTNSGIIIPETVQENRMATGTVYDIGPGKKNSKGILIPMTIKINDIVIFDRHRGKETIIDETTYMIISEDDVFGTLGADIIVEDISTDLGHLLPGDLV